MRYLTLLITLFISFCLFGQHNLEQLDRGLVAVKVPEGVFVSWRISGYEWHNTKFNLYKDDVLLNDSPLELSNYTDLDGGLNNKYKVATVVNGVEQDFSEEVDVWTQQYKEITLDLPPSGETPSGERYSYTVNDMSTGHLNDDDVLDLVVKWEALGRDNSHAGYTANVLLDGYTLEGEKLWRIDLGKNIRAGAHYTQFMVYDLDGDGIAEIACKTAPGTKDGLGNYISKGPAATANHEADYRNGSGYILDGPEYLTVFSGRTGEELATVEYVPPRGNVEAWGDGYGNRVDRFLAAIAYLDGENPSLIMTRGYYTRSVLAAYDFDGTDLSLRWVFDSDAPGNGGYGGQGNHNLSVADVDGDGKDEIIFGSCVINNDGTGLYTTHLGHGDAMHVADFDPYRKGLEVFRCLESGDGGSVLHSAADGEFIIHHKSYNDCGRCMGANVTNAVKGAQVWGCSPIYSATTQENLNHLNLSTSVNFRIYWDGDLLSELLDHTRITKPTNGSILFDAPGGLSNNGTKGTPALQADLFGDWREELIYRTSNPAKIRIYTTTIPTEHRIYSLMHDRQYRLAIAWQNVGYNQPPHLSYFLGETEGITTPPPPKLNNKRHVYMGGGDWDLNSENWSLDGQVGKFENGEHAYFVGGKDWDENVNITNEISPSILTVNTPGKFRINTAGGELSGEMKLIKQGSGEFYLNGSHSYSGETEIWDGSFVFNGELLNSNVWLNMHSSLSASGVLKKDLSLRYGSQLFVGGKDEVGNLVIEEDVYLEENAEIVFDFSGADELEYDSLTINGDINLEEGTIIRVVLKDISTIEPGSYPIITINSDVDIEKIRLKGIESIPSYLAIDDGKINLVIKESRQPNIVNWIGDKNSNWDLALTENFELDGDETNFVTDDEVLISDDAVNKTINVVETILPSKVIFTNDEDFTIDGEGQIGGDATLTKSGEGVLSIENVNSFTGKVKIEGGTLALSYLPNSLSGNGSIGGISSNASLFEVDNATLRIDKASQSERALYVGSNGMTFDTRANVDWDAKISGGAIIKTGGYQLNLRETNSNSEMIIRQGAVALTSEHATPGRKVIFEGGVLKDFDSGHSYSQTSFPMVVEDGQYGELHTDGRCTYNNILTGGGVFRIYIPWIRSDFDGNWSNFEGTLVLKTENPFRNYTSLGYPNAILDLDTQGVFDDMKNQTVKLGSVVGRGRLWGASVWEIGYRNEDFKFSGSITSGNVKKVGSGIMEINSNSEMTGTLTIAQGGVAITGVTNSIGTANVAIQNGAHLSGNGRVEGLITVAKNGELYAGYYIPDRLAAGSTLRVANVQMLAESIFKVKVNLSTNRADRLNCSGNFRANGTLEMMNVTEDTPYEEGMSFQIIRNGTRTGGFTNIIPETPGEGLEWDLSTFIDDGTIRVATATNIINRTTSKNVQVYPNPSTGILNVDMPDVVGKFKLYIESLDGKLLMHKELSENWNKEVNVEHLPNGIYLMRLSNEMYEYRTKIVIKK